MPAATALGPSDVGQQADLAASRHGILNAALPAPDAIVPNGWRRGFTYTATTCDEPTSWDIQDICDKTVGVLSTIPPRPSCKVVEVMPFVVRAKFQMDPLPQIDHVSIARKKLTAGLGKAMESHISAGTGHGRLTDPTEATVIQGRDENNPVAANQALVDLIQYLATVGPGGRGMVWASPALASIWMAQGYLQVEGQRLVTRVGGHIVCAAPGFIGFGPGDSNPGDATLHWAYATDIAYYKTSDPIIDGLTLAESLDADFNDRVVWARQTVAVWWDQCRLGAQCVSVSAP